MSLLERGPQLTALTEYAADAWHQAHGKQPPKLFGQKFTLVRAGNRYGLPDFYELHVWLWKTNPAGLFEDFNPTQAATAPDHLDRSPTRRSVQ